MRVAHVTLLTRPGCEACNLGKFILRRLKHHVTFTASVANILQHQQYMIYNDRLPVILVEAVPVCERKIVERDIREAVIRFNQSVLQP